jgi:type IV pilus assembly protein PilW
MTAVKYRAKPLRSARGLSLIEIMVSLAIAALLLLGLSQIFIGSKSAYLVQDGMSRAQESARFALNELEKNVRMVDYAGCGNRGDVSLQYLNHVVPRGTTPVLSSLRFNRPIEGYNATACPTTGSCALGQPAVGAAANWSPALPAEITTDANARPVNGSDVLILRIVSSESAPALGPFNPVTGAFVVGAVSGDTSFVKPGNLYALTSCRPRVDIFRASATSGSAAAGGLTMVAGVADNLLRAAPTSSDTTTTWGWNQAESDFQQPPSGTPTGTLNAEVHSADYIALFVGLSLDGNSTALKIQHFVGGVILTEELADGVEAMQIMYGQDTDNDGVANRFVPADQVAAGAVTEDAIDASWRQVLSVRIALLVRGETTGGTPANSAGAGNQYQVNDVTMIRPSDARFRDIYTTTIALRNRLVHN